MICFLFREGLHGSRIILVWFGTLGHADDQDVDEKSSTGAGSDASSADSAGALDAFPEVVAPPVIVAPPEVEPDLALAAPPGEVVVAPAAATAKKTVGLKEVAIAKSARSVCYICKANIPKDNVWLSYRFKASNRQGDERRIHTSCCKFLPVDTRSEDIKFVATELEEAVVGSPKHVALLVVLSELQHVGGGGGAASSGWNCFRNVAALLQALPLHVMVIVGLRLSQTLVLRFFHVHVDLAVGGFSCNLFHNLLSCLGAQALSSNTLRLSTLFGCCSIRRHRHCINLDGCLHRA